MNKSKLLLLLAAFAAMTACVPKEKPRVVLSSAYEYKLYLDDLLKEMPAELHGSDSALFVQNYINRWLQEKVLLHVAKNNLNEDELDLNEKLERYRNSLILYVYQRRYVEQNLDTLVSMDEIEEYYNSHKNDFMLKNNILKVAFIQLPNSSGNIKEVMKLLKNYNDNDKVKLSDIAERYAVNYHLDDEIWILLDDLLKVVPIKTYNRENFLRNNKIIKLKDSLYTTVLRISDFRVKNDVSPLSFEYDKIRMIIIGKRKQLLVHQLRKEVFEKAKVEGAIKLNY